MRFTEKQQLSMQIQCLDTYLLQICNSNIAPVISNHIFETHGHLLTNLNQPWCSTHRLQELADAVYHKDAPLSNCWGLIDNTVRPIWRPGQKEKYLCNGHKKILAIKFQLTAAPIGRWKESGMPVQRQLNLGFQIRSSCIVMMPIGILFVYMETQLTLCVHIYKIIFKVPDLMVSRKNLTMQ